MTVLEAQNKALIEELRQLKELYCQREETNNNNNNNANASSSKKATSSTNNGSALASATTRWELFRFEQWNSLSSFVLNWCLIVVQQDQQCSSMFFLLLDWSLLLFFMISEYSRVFIWCDWCFVSVLMTRWEILFFFFSAKNKTQYRCVFVFILSMLFFLFYFQRWLITNISSFNHRNFSANDRERQRL